MELIAVRQGRSINIEHAESAKHEYRRIKEPHGDYCRCIIGPLAQLVERRIFNPKVEGSTPSWLILASVVEQVYTLRLGRSFHRKCEFDSRHLQFNYGNYMFNKPYRVKIIRQTQLKKIGATTVL